MSAVILVVVTPMRLNEMALVAGMGDLALVTCVEEGLQHDGQLPPQKFYMSGPLARELFGKTLSIKRTIAVLEEQA